MGTIVDRLDRLHVGSAFPWGNSGWLLMGPPIDNAVMMAIGDSHIRLDLYSGQTTVTRGKPLSIHSHLDPKSGLIHVTHGRLRLIVNPKHPLSSAGAQKVRWHLRTASRTDLDFAPAVFTGTRHQLLFNVLAPGLEFRVSGHRRRTIQIPNAFVNRVFLTNNIALDFQGLRIMRYTLNLLSSSIPEDWGWRVSSITEESTIQSLETTLRELHRHHSGIRFNFDYFLADFLDRGEKAIAVSLSIFTTRTFAKNHGLLKLVQTKFNLGLKHSIWGNLFSRLGFSNIHLDWRAHNKRGHPLTMIAKKPRTSKLKAAA